MGKITSTGSTQEPDEPGKGRSCGKNFYRGILESSEAGRGRGASGNRKSNLPPPHERLAPRSSISKIDPATSK
jgi:hypothetical protein